MSGRSKQEPYDAPQTCPRVLCGEWNAAYARMCWKCGTVLGVQADKRKEHGHRG